MMFEDFGGVAEFACGGRTRHAEGLGWNDDDNGAHLGWYDTRESLMFEGRLQCCVVFSPSFFVFFYDVCVCWIHGIKTP